MKNDTGKIVFKNGMPHLLVNGATYPIPDSYGFTTEENEDELVDDIKYEGTWKNARPISFIWNNEEYILDYSEAQTQTKQTTAMLQNNGHAPYNFISLNHTLVPTDADAKHRDFSIYYGNSGYLEIEVKNLTHMFIRGGKENFFTMGEKGEVAIPGSTFHGLLRNITEIISYGKFGFYNNKKLHHRKRGTSHIPRRAIGFLKHTTEGYRIFESDEKYRPLYSCSDYNDEFTYVLNYKNEKLWIELFSGKMGKNNFEIPYSAGKKNYEIPDDVIKNYKADDNRTISRAMSKILELACKDKITDEFIWNYYKEEHEEVPFIGIPVWYELDTDGAIPKVRSIGHCRNYRVPYAWEIGDFNHLPEEINPNNPELSNIIDIATSLFGNDNSNTDCPGKVFVEEMVIESSSGFVEDALQILATPKPTAYQLYLEQKGADPATWDTKNAKIRGYKQYWHRNTENTNDTEQNWKKKTFSFSEEEAHLIFGDEVRNYGQWRNNKLNVEGKYEKFPPEIQMKLKAMAFKENTKLQFTIARVLRPNATFKGRIRFDNLTDVELGALLFALTLKKECKHKIGMGKPIGLGSIEIKSRLTLIDRKARYEKIFNDKGEWELPVVDNKAPEDLIKKFKDYIITQLTLLKSDDLKNKEGINVTDFDALVRIQELYRMLKYNEEEISTDEWLKKTSYMKLDSKENKSRYPLHTPDKI